MFEQALEDKLKSIFKVKKVSFDQPGTSEEQECMFVEVEVSKNTIKDGRARAKVTGKATMFGNSDKLPFGYFSKHIYQADPDDTKDLFFFDFETNTNRFQNIVERRFSFVYFYDSQYDPALGTIESVNLYQQVET